MLFTHDFSERGILDLQIVQAKYQRRINSLLKIIDEKNDIIFLYDNRKIPDKHCDLFLKANIDFRKLESEDSFFPLMNEFNYQFYYFHSYINKLTSVFTILNQTKDTPLIF